MLVAPSILSADFLCLGHELSLLEQAGADFIHVDIMDGHFVPNLTMGPSMVTALRRGTKLPLDVHLMIDNPESYLDAYAEAGANYLSVHVESCPHLERTIKHIKSLGLKAGVALNPSTNEASLKYIIDQLDLVLVMSVNPGFSGQSFLPLALHKIAAVKAMAHASNNTNCIISVDGGLNNHHAPNCKKAGATLLVAGSYIFSADYRLAISSLKSV